MNFEAVVQSAVPLLTSFVLKLVGAVALWIIGRWLINLAARLIVRSLRYPFDQTVAGYIGTAGPVLAVRPYCAGDDYWQVYFDTNRTIREVFGSAGFAAPEQRVRVRSAT